MSTSDAPKLSDLPPQPTSGADAGHEDVRGGDAASELQQLQQMQQAMSNVVTQVGQQATTPIRNIRG